LVKRYFLTNSEIAAPITDVAHTYSRNKNRKSYKGGAVGGYKLTPPASKAISAFSLTITPAKMFTNSITRLKKRDYRH
jgi:hypothetical protein